MHHEHLSERDCPHPPPTPFLLNPGVGQSCEKMKHWVIDLRFLHLICSLVAGACDSKQGQRKKGCVELMVRISVSILTSSSEGLEQPDTTSRFLYRHKGLTTRRFFPRGGRYENEKRLLKSRPKNH